MFTPPSNSVSDSQGLNALASNGHTTGPADLNADEALVERAKAGDSAAFDTLVGRYSGKVFRLATRFVGTAADAEEILQDTFLRVYRKLDSFRGDSKFSTWLYRVATNCALMHIRKNKRHRAESLDQGLPEFTDEGYLARHDIDYGRPARADEILERAELAREALLGVQGLPEIYKTVFVLRDLEELSTEETAKVLDIESGTVRQRLHRARLMLRGHLQRAVGEAA